MKIIKYGKKPDDIEYIKKCSNCNTVFVFKEAESTYDLDMNGNVDHLVQCPVCDYSVPIGLFKKIYNPRKHGEVICEIKFEKENPTEKMKIGFRKENENDRTTK